jgi:hypothetical protein
MNEFLNFHDTWILFQHNYVWLILALLIGAYVGFTTCIPSQPSR